jgi:uncharacterized protein (TIGR00369 family)
MLKSHDELVDWIEERMPFNKFVGIRVVTLAKGYVRLRLPYDHHLLGDTRRGALHGGVHAVLADTCGAFAVWSTCELEDKIATVDLRVDYLRPAIGKDLIGEAAIQSLGTRLAHTHTILYSHDNSQRIILAEARAVYSLQRENNSEDMITNPFNS